MTTPLYLALAAATLAAMQPGPLHGQTTSPAAGSTVVPNQAPTDGFIMAGGKTYVVRRGVATPLEQEITLRITPTAIVGFDQVPRTITSNAMLTMDGRIVAAPQGLTFPPVRQLIGMDPRLQDRGVYGSNLSGLSPGASASPAGPRNIIAKKKSTVARTSTTAKRAKTAKPEATPAFSDDILPLPNQKFSEDGSLNPIIDAGSTMLSITTTPESPVTPETGSIRASLGITVNPTEELKMSPPVLPTP